MKIVGSSKQDGIPKPDNPVQITNETVLIITDKEGNKKEMPFKYEKILKEEEDIMILETECYYLEELGYLRENNHFIRFNQALKNLIKGYKLEKLKNVLDEQSLKEALEDYIPKSLIKEKIEPVINNLERDGFVGYADELRDIISELMEGK